MLFIGLIVLIASAILHEIMHGVVAEKLGDPTARLSGRITLNPLPHIDPIMTILVPLLLVLSGSPIIFGAAKPVPVNPLMLKDGRKDLAIVALAGPLTNLLIAFIAALLLQVAGSFPPIVSSILSIIILYNLVLGFLNMIPIPPLDGSKFFSIVLSEELSYKYQSIAPYGIFILFALLLFTPFGQLLWTFVRGTMNLLGANVNF